MDTKTLTPAVDEPDWEDPPPRGPLLRWRTAGAGLTLVAILGLTWWLVAWLTAPAPPDAVPAGAVGPASAAGSAAHEAGAAPLGATAATPEGQDGGGRSAAAANPSGRVRVHVVGQVRRPGVVELPAGARVADAVAAAGGARELARTDRINLAAPVVDGQQVVVPDAQTAVEPAAVAGEAPDGGPTPRTGSGASAADGSGGGPATVDLNTADLAALQTLPGVGPATAEKIIAQRESVGPFSGLQDLDAVPGIGPATLDRLKDHVTW